MKKTALRTLLAGALFLITQSLSFAQDASLKLLDWSPKSELVVRETQINHPRYPVIDIHNHLGRLENMERYLRAMDSCGVWITVSLDGHSKNDFYKQHLKKCKEIAADRLLVFFAPDWTRIDQPDFGTAEANRLEQAVAMGVRGVKVAKELGLVIKDKSGKVVPVDDPRLDPIWTKCAELKIPVMIHISDPKAFFRPIDKYNERYDELAAHPDWSFYGDQFPPKNEIIAQRNRVIARHPNTIFIGAHVANLPEDLGTVGMWLDQYPNLYIDIDARISELGRQPYTARKFFIRYQDRILFGSDTPPRTSAYHVYYRFLETEDEYFDPAPSHHQQGRWMIYGVHLPDEVLKKVYYKNALKLLKMPDTFSIK